MNIFSILDKKDTFFFWAGILLCIVEGLLHWIDLPDHMKSGRFLVLLLDHTPFSTVAVLFISIFFLVLFEIAVMNQSKCLSRMTQHLSHRIQQFSSPAFFILIGYATPIFTVSLFCRNITFFWISFVVLIAGFIFLLFSFGSTQFVRIRKETEIKPRVALGLSLLIVIMLFCFMVYDKSPKGVEVKFEYELYTKIKKAAHKEGISINDYIQRASVRQLEFNQ